ncbi:MAG: hypothetical protein WA970_22790, partial [Gammaproteobacteria bacterium]
MSWWRRCAFAHVSELMVVAFFSRPTSNAPQDEPMISLRRWRHCCRLRREHISNSMWNELAAGAPIIAQYAGADRTKLRRLTQRFLLKKDIRGVGG